MSFVVQFLFYCSFTMLLIVRSLTNNVTDEHDNIFSVNVLADCNNRSMKGNELKITGKLQKNKVSTTEDASIR